MPTAKKAAPRKPRRVARNAGTAGTPVASGGVAGGATTGTTAGSAGGVIQGELATTAETPWGTLGWFAIDTEGATVHFGIDQQKYFLDASAANYNALFSMLLACWLEARRIQLTYAIERLVPNAPADAPRRILSLLSI
jgi:hypothetical protein